MDSKDNIPTGDCKQDALLARLGGSAIPDGDSPSDIPEEIIKDLVQPAAKLFGQSLKSTSTVKSPRVAAAKWVLEQWFKIYTPNTSRSEVHIIDHATLKQMEQAEKIMEEYNGFLSRQLSNRGGMDVGDN